MCYRSGGGGGYKAQREPVEAVGFAPHASQHAHIRWKMAQLWPIGHVLVVHLVCSSNTFVRACFTFQSRGIMWTWL